MTHGATLGGHAVEHAIQRAGIEPGEVDDVHHGLRHPEGATGANIARQIALRAGCPVTVSGMTINRFCSSGLQTIATGGPARDRRRRRRLRGRRRRKHLLRAAGNEHPHAARGLAQAKNKPEIYWNMLQTAEQVAKRYNISRDRMDEYGALSQQRPSPRWRAGLFKPRSRPSPSRPAWPTRSWA
jgi:acetyl-CoA C-acetyltransferase